MTKFLGSCAFTVAAALLLPAPVSAQEVTLTASLSGEQETPAVLLTGAVGTVEAGIDTVNREISVTLRVFNIPAVGPTTAGHFHVGPKGAGGPVVLDFPASIAGRVGDFTMTFRLGEANFRARPELGIVTLDDMIQAMTAGNAYATSTRRGFPVVKSAAS